MGGGIYAHGSGTMSFSAGTFQIGAVTTTSNCNCKSNYSICLDGSGSLTFGGPSTFTLAGGIYQNASGTPGSPPIALSLGYGSSTNSFSIGKGSDGYSLNNANGATLFGDASGAGDLFQMAGGLMTSGGTCVAVSAAAEHDINGSINGAGGIVLGSGIYTVNGYVALGNGGGGDVSNCPTSRHDDRVDRARRDPRGLRRQHRELRLDCVCILSRRRLQHGQPDRADLVLDVGQQHRRARGDRPAIVEQHGDGRIHHRGDEYPDFRGLLFSQRRRQYERRRHSS